MEQVPPINQDIRRKKFLLALPLLAYPFLTLLFWSQGGGKGSAANPGAAVTGFNMNLPLPHLKDEHGWNKLTFYLKAEKDSAKLNSEAGIGQPVGSPGNGLGRLELPFGKTAGKDFRVLPGSGLHTPNAEADSLNAKLANLRTALVQQQTGLISGPALSIPSAEINPLMSNAPIPSTRDMVKGEDSDRQLAQLNSLLDKVIAIQHPNQGQKKDSSTSFPVSPYSTSGGISVMNPNTPAWEKDSGFDQGVGGFYGMEDGESNAQKQGNTIGASIQGTQTVVSGSTVRLRLLDDLRVDGQVITAGNLVYGTVYLENERLNIIIKTIRDEESIFPVTLEAYDLDGMAGIFIPGSLNREVGKESGDEGINSIGLETLDPTLAGQAEGAGIQAAKALFSRKIRLVRVTLRNGYRVMLRDNRHS